jgi:hypothetical protein
MPLALDKHLGGKLNGLCLEKRLDCLLKPLVQLNDVRRQAGGVPENLIRAVIVARVLRV